MGNCGMQSGPPRRRSRTRVPWDGEGMGALGSSCREHQAESAAQGKRPDLPLVSTRI